VKILNIFAHCDDHIIFGWPVLQNKEYEKSLLVITVPGQTAVLKSCTEMKTKYLGNTLLNNKFSIQLKQPLYDAVNMIRDKIKICINEIKPDYIFTHNPMGEYGHYDHQLLFDIVYNLVESIPVLITNILVKSQCWLSKETIPKQYQALYHNKIDTIEPDIDFYKRQADIFKEEKVWTTNQYFNFPLYPKETSLYSLGKL